MSLLARIPIALLLAFGLIASCAKIPKDRYGIKRVHIQGAKQLDKHALKACMATKGRSTFEISTAPAECGVPPFRRKSVHLPLWSWSWAEWPALDQAVLEKDIERIERWYRARGYYDAKVVQTETTPVAALSSDRIPDDAPCRRRSDEEGCIAEVSITVEEGEPIRIRRIALTGTGRLEAKLHEALWDAMEIKAGDPFDEAYYDLTKSALQRVLANASHARAMVTGEVVVDPALRTAEVRLHLEPGPRCRFGSITVEGNEELPVQPILTAAALESGGFYSESALEDAQGAIFGLGAFSSVAVEPQFDRERARGKNADRGDERLSIIDVVINVSPGRMKRFGIGGGIQSGHYFEGLEQQDIPQWDVHLLTFYEHRNLFGGLRRFRLEERPRLIFSNVFPRLGECCSQPFDDARDPILGNVTSFSFRQPSFLEARTTLVLSARWDLGPDPFFREREFYRHDIDSRIALERFFLKGKLYASMGINANILRKFKDRDGVPADYEVMFLQQLVSLDLRDRPSRPSKGVYLAMTAAEAGFFLPSTWDYIRLVPEARAYVPLPFGLVLAARMEMGMMFVFGSELKENDISNSLELGPFRYRLRGGGPNSHRGYLPGRLGQAPGVEGINGGLRRWEASVELRARITESFGLTIFTDMGDVNPDPSFRFSHTNLAVGGGLRYYAFFGTLRFDVGWLVPGGAVLGGNDPPNAFNVDLGFATFPGAVHFTLGEAF